MKLLTSVRKKKNYTLQKILIPIFCYCYCNNNYYIGNRADKLQKAEVEVWTNKECQLSFDAQQKKQKIQSTQMCAGRKNGGIDACWV